MSYLREEQPIRACRTVGAEAKKHTANHAIYASRTISLFVLLYVSMVSGYAAADRIDDLRETEEIAEIAIVITLSSTPELALEILNKQIHKLAKKDVRDPAMARLLIIRAALHTFDQDVAAAKSDIEAALQVNYFVTIPTELRTDRLSALLAHAQKNVTRPVWKILGGHSDDCASVVTLDFLFAELNPSDDQVLVWRFSDDNQYHEIQLESFDNIAATRIMRNKGTSKELEYFIRTTSPERIVVSTYGSAESPLRIPPCRRDQLHANVHPVPHVKPGKRYPRITLALLLGTSVGIVSGTADLSYDQYSPRDPLTGDKSIYGPREYSCAITRWIYPQDELPIDSASLESKLLELQGLESAFPLGVSLLGTQMSPASVALAYDPSYCSAHHRVPTGVASAPFHIAPEFGLMLTDNIHFSVFSRLQLVTGSKVYRERTPRDVGYTESFINNVYDYNKENPDGLRVRPPFAWTVGAKLRYFLGEPRKKVRLFVGAFGGYGTARMRINMKFPNDRNGNSIPDDREYGYDVVNEEMSFDSGANPCTPVWPYSNSCTPGDGTSPQTNPGDFDRTLALDKVTASDKSPRVDTVGIGKGFFGGVLGAHYQITKSFALVGELQIGGWFGKNQSLLWELSVAPMIMF